MRILILGANGRTGQLATSEALNRGHTVTALVRRPDSMPVQQGVDIIQGSPLDLGDIEKVFSASSTNPIEAVVVALNAARASDSPFSQPVAPPFMVRDAVRNVTTVMQKYGVSRIVIMSGFGVGSSYEQLPYLLRLLFRYTNMRPQMEDHEATNKLVIESEALEWTLVRPPMLREGEAIDVKEFGETGKGVGLFSGITRSSVASFMLAAVEERKWFKKAIVIAN